MKYHTKIIAVDCLYKGKDYDFYVQHCGVKCVEPLTERQYIDLGNSLENA